MAAVEWTIKEGDPIAGGTVYHLADRMDAGAIAAQEWCFVKKGETARELWERALAPLGQKLLGRGDRLRQGPQGAAGEAAGRAVRDQGAELSRIESVLTFTLNVKRRIDFASKIGAGNANKPLFPQEQFSILRRTKFWSHLARISVSISDTFKDGIHAF